MNNRSLDEQRTEERSDELGEAKEQKGEGERISKEYFDMPAMDENA